MQQAKFKTGDWCFCEFKLQQILETEENRVTEVSDGSFRMSGNNLSDRCFPLDLKIKKVSDYVSYWSDRFHKLNNNSLNYPDLNRELIQRWAEMCENINDEKVVTELYKRLETFGSSIVNKINELKYESVEGVLLFR